MKKFLISLLFIIILAGTAFFFGWVQLQVPPGQYGIISSKTHGIDPELVRSGEFRWVWYKLIPTNVKISVFDLKYNKFPINFNGILPSGNTYSAFVGLTNADFSWNLQGEIGFNINPDMLISLASKNNFTDKEGFNIYLMNIAAGVQNIVQRSLASAADSADRIELLLSGSSDSLIESEIKAKYPEIHDFSLSIKSAKYPDFVLYKQLRLLYEEYLAKQRDSIKLTFEKRAENQIETHLRFDELEKYGELLSKYPKLMEYLELEKKR